MSESGPARIRVLVVEDDTTSRKLLRRSLERAGCDVVEAASGEEGLDRFGSEQPDMVVMDIGLPGIDGYRPRDESSDCRVIASLPSSF